MRSTEDKRRTRIGVGLASAIIVAWAALHVYGVHFFELTWPQVLLAPFLMAALCWLSVGLFIISHDAIHGSLAPQHPGVNRAFGWVTMTLYAGFDYDRLKVNHDLHHDAPGTADDPDFSASEPRRFVPWFREFFTRHFGLRPLIFVNAVVAIYWLVLGAPMVNIVLFYGVPALGSALQLFYFGTYRPHRHEGEAPAFADDHRARSSSYGWLPSLLTCYHFGYHHEHHLYPHEPWWRLPARRMS
ncbi:fatty acid desaturase [Parvularcula maris]|uniref:Fatty acid desaturase n=1 Tax=Parvularcula maris TaxID=2965077 RepID=A0A9X2RHJ0_9PROT|nr:fatty acid desaturase [Parvularcula maris]MCQ8184995.1 fatty acid desaturase [Parvularcula maris]